MRYLITGGTGSFGKRYVKWLTENTDAEIVVFSRSELNQWEMRKEFPGVHYIGIAIKNRAYNNLCPD